jgi:hypothetical protein
MTDRTRREHTMKRIATIAAVLTTAAVVAPVATAGNVAQVRSQDHPQLSRVQVAQVARANAAITAQVISSQRSQALRFSTLLRAMR